LVSTDSTGSVFGEGVKMKVRTELYSKFFDGFLPGLILFLLFVVALLLVNPIEYTTGKPGVMVYALALLAVSMICLERAVNTQTPDINRALNGMASGALAWVVVELSNYIGSFAIESVTGVLIFIMVILITATIWRRGLPMGIQYFSGTFVLLWGGYLVVAAGAVFSEWVPETLSFYNRAGWIFILLAALAAALILVRSMTRLERLWGSVLIAFFMLLALYTLQGPSL
jgi:hypothetical protein